LLVGPRRRPGQHPLAGQERGGGAGRHHHVHLVDRHQGVEEDHRHQQHPGARPAIGERALSGQGGGEGKEEEDHRPAGDLTERLSP
jgi:hypothetical protein